MTNTDPVVGQFVRRPTLTSSGIAVIAGVLSVGLLADTAIQRRLLALAVLGSTAFGIGGRYWLRERAVGWLVVAGCGTLLVALTAGAAAIQPPQLIHRLELLPGIVGLWLLVAALIGVRVRWSRPLVDVGTGLLFLGVLTSGVVYGATTTTLVIAAATTLLAWDAGENAVSMGRQIGAHDETASSRAELVHSGVTGAVAGSAVVVVLGVAQLSIDGLPFGTLVALLIAGVVLALASHE